MDVFYGNLFDRASRSTSCTYVIVMFFRYYLTILGGGHFARFVDSSRAFLTLPRLLSG